MRKTMGTRNSLGLASWERPAREEDAKQLEERASEFFKKADELLEEWEKKDAAAEKVCLRVRARAPSQTLARLL